jgi:nitrite reductase (NADH) small subunit
MNDGPEYQRILAVSDIRPGRAVVRTVNGHEIAFFRVGDAVHAVSNVCPHQHAPVLAEGELCGNVITCPMHGWQYEVTTGLAVNASGRLRTYPCRVVDGQVQVEVPEAAEPAW